ncbi:peptidase S8 [bacterium]|nr:peptidase S8 [bacterium]
MYLDGAGYLQNYESVKKEKEKREKDKDKKKDGDITIEAVPSNYWFSVGTNSPTFSRVNNGSDLRDFNLRCIVTDGSNTTKTSNEFYVDVVADPPPQGNIIADNKNNDVISLAKDSEEISIPTDYALNQNYPNPFNPTTKISYSLPDANFVTLKIYDMLGSEVATLVNENKPAGKFEVEFDASRLSSGTYVYKLIAGNYQLTKKMQLVK